MKVIWTNSLGFKYLRCALILISFAFVVGNFISTDTENSRIILVPSVETLAGSIFLFFVFLWLDALEDIGDHMKRSFFEFVLVVLRCCIGVFLFFVTLTAAFLGFSAIGLLIAAFFGALFYVLLVIIDMIVSTYDYYSDMKRLRKAESIGTVGTFRV